MATTKSVSPRLVFISAIASNSSVYTLRSEQKVEINGEENDAKDIKIGDVVTFTYYYDFNKTTLTHTLTVKYLASGNCEMTCFTGECIVTTPDGQVQVSTLSIGDLIQKPDGTMCKVHCILETFINSDVTMCSHVEGGLIITPYHPVKIGENWEFPTNTVGFETKNHSHQLSLFNWVS
jgi:hypothetical protein